MSNALEEVNLARIRDNQRRSRARRKEYLQELEARLRSCELQGVAASAEIQTAARKVADENKKLRALLARNGIGHDTIEIYLTTSSGAEEMMSRYSNVDALTGNSAQILEESLKQRKDCCTKPSLYKRPTRTRDKRDRSVSSLRGSKTLPGGNLKVNRAPATIQTRAMISASMASPPSSIDHSPNHSLQHIQQKIPHDQQQVPNQSPTSALANQIFDYNTQYSPQGSSYNMPQHSTAQKHLQLHNAPHRSFVYAQPTARSLNVNSCSDATDMITTMAGADPHAIRMELGCLPDMDCDVDNQIVFDVMDRYSNSEGL